MRILVKTIQQQSLYLEVEPSFTMLQVKQAIQEKTQQPPELQKLIFSGKILNDQQTIEGLGITEKDFMVAMFSKPKNVPVAPVSTPTPVAAPQQSAPAAPAATTLPAAAAATAERAQGSETTATVVPAAESATNTTPTVYNPYETLLTGEAYENAVKNIMEMGFEREQAIKAMRASFGNPDRAVEYLMTGFPPEFAQATEVPTATPAAAAVAPPPPAAAPAPVVPPRSGAGAGAGGANADLSFLRNDPQFLQLRQMLQQQPELLQPLLAQIGQANPQILQMINANPTQFMQLLMEGSGGGAGGGGGISEGGEDDDEEGGGGGGQRHYIEVTPEEQAAIQRLESMGFSRAAVIEAYFACDKNEEVAANYLFDHMQDFDDSPFQ